MCPCKHRRLAEFRSCRIWMRLNLPLRNAQESVSLTAGHRKSQITAKLRFASLPRFAFSHGQCTCSLILLKICYGIKTDLKMGFGASAYSFFFFLTWFLKDLERSARILNWTLWNNIQLCVPCIACTVFTRPLKWER